MPNNELTLHGWSNDKSYCDFANWWDCSFWCGNNKIFGKNKPPHERKCPMDVPNYNNCTLVCKRHKNDRIEFNIVVLGLMLRTNPKKKTFTLTRQDIEDLLNEYSIVYQKAYKDKK